uniref:CDP-diacylglycerol--glycerol-3-phosphate 3-phosphatidyltransferase n=1 Tax=Eimeria falciformis TaxID=84963 RepID=A0A221S605_9EIME|nr:phosphatidylglycerol-phosphate synthase [Eimeria falciformis]
MHAASTRLPSAVAARAAGFPLLRAFSSTSACAFAAEAEAKAPEVSVAVPPRCISVIRGPKAFFSAVLRCIGLAQRRLLLSSLYIGTGEKEQLLLQQLLQRMQQQQHQLKVRLLLDFLRSTRPGTSGYSPAMLLLPLLQQGPQSDCQVSLFLNPLTCSSSSSSKLPRVLQQVLLKALGHREREALGTQHMKCLVSDDLLLLTGANLSNEYFTYRTDRCLLIRSKPLADAVERILAAAEAHAFRLLPPQQQQQQQSGEKVEIGGVACVWPQTNPSKPPQADAEGFCRSLSAGLSAAVSKSRSSSNSSSSNSSSNPAEASGLCFFSLAVQAGFALPPIQGQQMLLHRIHKIAANSVVAAAAATAAEPPETAAATAAGAASGERVDTAEPTRGIQVTVASPYLNFPLAFLWRLQHLLQLMRLTAAAAHTKNSSGSSSKSRLVVVTASPQANSFFNSRGLSYWIPAAYAVAAHVTAAILGAPPQAAAAAAPAAVVSPYASASADQQQQQDESLLLLEFARPGWTFHAKGIWVSPETQFSSSSSSTSSNSSSSTNSSSRVSLAEDSELVNPKSTHLLLKESLLSRGSEAGGSSKGGWRVVSLLGSSNLSVRSSLRDLELLALLRTRDSRLQQEQQREIEATLLPFCLPLTKETLKTRFPAWLKFAVQNLGLGSLL